ncbi:hypothetical protein [Xanthomonas translucens]|uniref:Tle cognate immunity protein 4 C-terminal domain-containing protein n=5 Tax=Xanthomonas campestris pv. translucens TaxID=343 RepID=A0A120EWC0_XANCT|nr:hypothetical protein [Xanthomonas translucens]KWV12647.1 hypothetical protein ATB53_17345 [Xanthomonas translucens]MCC8448418.1 hypothetical protein [Xanthomonas translucens pv. translucens]MCT8287743.1 hypothetical protein [Xanthomonas translucens pv. translucens]MCT8305401.1 hypothetical protein [Xanthomonas translucens pv. translucens]QSQ30754.1 hypothetical protein ISN30_02335 [Xanthomonas translucens pv. translucens]
MRSVSRLAFCLLLTSVLPMVGCAKPSAADSPAATSTNAQGCARKRHLGHQDPFQTPPPLMEACLGPYTLRIPANYFGDQMGPNFDDSFGLYLEYPTLEPFAPGERSHLSLDVATRTVNIGYSYLDRVDVREALRNQYTPSSSEQDNPAERLESRIRGATTYGLTPYYADLPKVFAYYRAKGYSESHSDESTSIFNAASHKDWYVARDDKGQISTIIKCTSKEVTQSGVEYHDGKLVRNKEEALPECDHFFIVPDLKVLVEIRYVRFALSDWKRAEETARDELRKFMVEKPHS